MHKFRRIIFRLFILIITVVLLSYGSLITASSANNVDFVLSDCNCDNNRIFTISMTADSDKKLCAASFEFTYDKSMFEFRSAKASDKTSKIAYNELSDKVKLVFLNADGININNGESIFTLTLKAVKSGTGYIDFFVSDCVNSDINSIDAGKCTSAKITVNSKSDKSGSDKSNSSDNAGKSESSGSKSERKKTEESTSVSSYDEIGQLNSFDNPNTRLLIVGIALGASIIAAVMLVYNIIKKIKSNSDKHKNSPD